jgi:hypothetical protein
MQTKEVEEEAISSPSLDGLDRVLNFILPTDGTEGRKVQGSMRDLKGLKCWRRKVNTRLGKSQKSERIPLLVEIIIKRSEQPQESYHSKADYYFRRTPRRGGRQQPHQTLIKGRKYKGGRKCHRMVALSVPMMLLWSHSFLKINPMLV